jgi:hypothetical protein
MENAIKQPDQELSVRKSIEFFCKNNEEVKCVKDTFNVKIDKFKGHINYVISYQIEGKFLTKWPIKIKMNSEKNSNSM